MITTKSAMTVSAVAFALLFGGGVYIVMNLNTLAKPITERIARNALGVDVSIGSMDIDLKAKRVSVKDIEIDNPSGFSKPHIITIDQADVALITAGTSLINFDLIDVSGVDAYLEVKESGTNLQALQKSIAAQASSKEEAENTMQVIIDTLTMDGMTLHPSVTLLETQDFKTIKVPDLRLSGIGERQNGVLAKQAVAQGVQELTQSFSAAASREGLYQGLSPEVLKEMGNTQLDALKNSVNEEINNAADQIKGLFE